MKKLFIIIAVVLSMVFASNVLAQDNAAIVGQVQAGANLENYDNRVSNVYDRKFVNPALTVFPPTNGFFTAPTPDSSFRSIFDILTAYGEGNRVRFNKGALMNMAKGGKVALHIQITRGSDSVPRVYTGEEENADQWLTIGVDDPVTDDKGNVIGRKKLETTVVTGLMDGEAGNGKTNSMQVIGQVGLKVLRDGNNLMIITAEGAHRKVEASGWGVGFYTTGGTVSGTGEGSTVGGGGTGYSSNQTGPEDRPWIQGYFGTYEDALSK